MAKKREDNPRRYRQVREDASIASTERTIAHTMGLPEGSIKLILPNGRKAISDASVKSLRAKYK